MDRLSASPRSFTYNKLISASAKASHWTLALNLFEELYGLRLADVVSVASAVKACEMGCHWASALQLLQVLPRIDIDAVLLTAAVSACEKACEWMAALRLFLDFQRQVELDEIFCNAAISACAKGHQWRFALTLLEQMELLRISRSTVTYSCAISAAKGNWTVAMHLFGKLRNMGLVPDLVAFAAALNACDGSRWTLALQLLYELQELTSTPDVVCCTAAISACEKGQQWPLALWLLRSVADGRANVVAYGAAISACRKSEQWQWAVHLLQQLQATELEANVIAYNATIDACQDHWCLAVQLVADMGCLALQADLLSHSSALSSVAQGHHWRQAMRMMPREGCDPLLCNPLITACGRAAAWSCGLLLFHFLQTPNVASYAAALEAEDQAAAAPLLERMQLEALSNAGLADAP